MNFKHTFYTFSGIILVSMMPLMLCAQPRVVKVHRQQKFARDIPAGDYSGIAWLGGHTYAMVSDKGDGDGFWHFQMAINERNGRIDKVSDMKFAGNGNRKNRDAEGIAYFPERQTVFISGETDGRILEYTLEGELTGRELPVPEYMKHTRANRGFEALTYSPHSHLFWTTTESMLPKDGVQAPEKRASADRLRFLAFNDSLQLKAMYVYQMDLPTRKKKASIYVNGVSELLGLPDGSLLVLEREVCVPRRRIGANVACKIYHVEPLKETALDTFATLDENTPTLPKKLLTSWKTKMNLTRQNFANYEGMCLGPALYDDVHPLILVCDSQHQHAGILRDWLKIILLDLSHTDQ